MSETPKTLLTAASRDDVHVLSLLGRLDHGVSADFDSDMTSQTDQAITNGQNVVIDLSAVTFLSSIILKVIRSQKDRLGRQGLKLALCSPNAVVREILSIARFDFVAGLHDCFEDASASFGKN